MFQHIIDYYELEAAIAKMNRKIGTAALYENRAQMLMHIQEILWAKDN